VRKHIRARSVSVCLISSHPLVLENFQRLLARRGFPLQGRQIRATKMAELRAMRIPRAQLFLVDVGAAPQLADKLVSTILSRRPGARVIMLGERFSESNAFPLLRLGVRGFLTYHVAERQLPRAIQQVAAGGYWVSRDLLHRFTESVLAPRRRHRLRAPTGLSAREQQVLEGLLGNLSNKEIAARLHISERTVKFHVSNLLTKYGVQRRAELLLLHFQSA
jgi:DNA-binding NarL/FixJ family response regulator